MELSLIELSQLLTLAFVAGLFTSLVMYILASRDVKKEAEVVSCKKVSEIEEVEKKVEVKKYEIDNVSKAAVLLEIRNLSEYKLNTDGTISTFLYRYFDNNRSSNRLIYCENDYEGNETVTFYINGVEVDVTDESIIEQVREHVKEQRIDNLLKSINNE
jgi:hypothetical protein